MSRYMPDNRKEGYRGYTTADALADYESGTHHIVLHDTLNCPHLRGLSTITVWDDNLQDEGRQAVYLHAPCTKGTT